MVPQELIARKRDGAVLSPGELGAFLQAYMDGAVGDDQMAAFLMAVYFRGLSADELDALVEAMIHSGRALEREGGGAPRVDKHSTGGVGDKVSLALAPLAAEMGMVVPMMSGRGLGHTGGTLDKLEAVPGFRTRIPLEEFDRVLARVGCAMIGQTDEIAPLDRRLYALRDVTATVPSLPLITASIMSKKLAEGLDALVLDVKVGQGAFLPEIDQARELARAMVRAGTARGLAVTALLTAMDQPLGRAVGHALEVDEAVACLSGRGPDDFRSLVVELAAEMAVAGGVAAGLDEGRAAATAALDEGGALERFGRLVAAQGGDAGFLARGEALAEAPCRTVVEAERDGFVAEIEPKALGYGLVAMGGGRARQDEEIDHRVGFELEAKAGDAVARGRPLAVVHGADSAGLAAGVDAVRKAVRISEEAPVPGPLPLLIERVSA